MRHHESQTARLIAILLARWRNSPQIPFVLQASRAERLQWGTGDGAFALSKGSVAVEASTKLSTCAAA
eukprot:285257-Karenia_brevis.AAC.1